MSLQPPLNYALHHVKLNVFWKGNYVDTFIVKLECAAMLYKMEPD